MIINLGKKIKKYELFYILGRFWKEIYLPRKYKNQEYITYLLKEYAKEKVYATRLYNQRRKTKTISNREKLKFRSCFACFKSFLPKERHRFLEVHHIIEIENGGNDFGRNTICVCKECHNKIHQPNSMQGKRV